MARKLALGLGLSLSGLQLGLSLKVLLLGQVFWLAVYRPAQQQAG